MTTKATSNSFSFTRPEEEVFEAFKALCDTPEIDMSMGAVLRKMIRKAVKEGRID